MPKARRPLLEQAADGSWQVITGDALDVLPTLPLESHDLLLADPPFSSGGMVRGDRAQNDTIGKYSRSHRSLELAGDTRDQLQWIYWCGAWLRASLPLLTPGAIVGVFIDWRQVAALYAAFGLAGVVLRGLCPWLKGQGRPQPGRPRQDSEFIVWGTKGPRKRVGPWYPGHYDDHVLSAERKIFCRKPTELLRKLVRWCPEGGRVLDPFAGSGPTGVGAILEGRRCTLIELNPANAAYCRGQLRTYSHTAALRAPP